MDITIIYIIIAAIALIVGVLAGKMIFSKNTRKRIEEAEQQSQKILADARLSAETLKKELHHLKTVVRKKITDAIAEARAHGDLKENAEYHAAREQQSFSEGRIQEIEAKLSHAQVIDVSKLQNNGRIVFGATAHLINTETDEEVVYQVVGEDEADIK